MWKISTLKKKNKKTKREKGYLYCMLYVIVCMYSMYVWPQQWQEEEKYMCGCVLRNFYNRRQEAGKGGRRVSSLVLCDHCGLNWFLFLCFTLFYLNYPCNFIHLLVSFETIHYLLKHTYQSIPRSLTSYLYEKTSWKMKNKN